jgi:hypothetical protein
VIGNENCFNLDKDFIEKSVARVTYLLRNKQRRSKCNPEFDLKANSIKEGNIYRSILEKSL